MLIYLTILVYEFQYEFGEKLIYKAHMGEYMSKKRLSKRGTSQIWKTLIIVIVTLIVGILFFVILKDRIGGLLHLS